MANPFDVFGTPLWNAKLNRLLAGAQDSLRPDESR